jgi:hypothetical protein
MCNKVIYIFIPFLLNITQAQTISIGAGQAHQLTEQSERLVNGKNVIQYSGIYKLLKLSYPINNYDLILEMSNFKGITGFSIGGANNFTFGFTGTKINKITLGASIHLLKRSKKNYLKPHFLISAQNNKKIADLWGDQININGPDYFQIGTPYSIGKNCNSIVYALGFEIGRRIYNSRFKIGLKIDGTIGTKSYQKIIFNYTYRNEPNIKRRAIFESKGTGIFGLFVLQYDLKR